MLKIIICIITAFYCSKILNIGINLWQSLPLKEEKSTPIYIVKEIKEN